MKVLITVNEDTPVTIKGLQIGLTLAITLGGLIFSYAVSTFKVSALQDRMSTVELRQTKYDENYNDLKNSVTRIETLLDERLPPKKSY